MNKIVLYIIIVLSLVHFCEVKSQAKYDNIWILGYPENLPEFNLGGVIVNFEGNEFSSQYFQTICPAREPAVLSTRGGKLQAYSDGCNIYNAAHEIMVNGDSIAYGLFWRGYCEYGYPGTQHHLLLPWPGDSSRAILFYFKTLDDFSTYHLLYSIIRFTPSVPLGIIEEKDIFLLDAGTTALLTATIHGNGRDWWMVVPEDATNGFYKILLTAEGIKDVSLQNIGTPWDEREWAGQAVFSPDGKKYIRFNPWKGLDIFDFDRCSGELSNPIESGPFSNPVLIGGGVACAANSKYLYVSNLTEMYQYDLSISDILSSRIHIGSFDGYSDPFPNNFFHLALAPDEKIYVFSTNSKRSFHVIEEPEREGINCRFTQHSIQLPANIFIGGVNLPYFRLGPDDGSVCDTFGMNNIPVALFSTTFDTLSNNKIYIRNLSYYNPDTFTWTVDDQIVSEIENPDSLSFNAPGYYDVCLHVSSNFGSDLYCETVFIEDTTTSVDYLEHGGNIAIYPNPVNATCTIAIPGHLHGAEVTMYSADGVVVGAHVLHEAVSELSLEHLSPGIYFGMLSMGNKLVMIRRIVKL